jgi:hypothetical protein
MENECLNCGKKTRIKPSQVNRKKYCSRNCKTEHHKKNPPAFWKKITKKKTLLCDYCEKEFSKKQSEINKNNFCCLECCNLFKKENGHENNQHLKNRVKIICEICRKTFEVPKNREFTARFCSKKCLGIANGLRGQKELRNRLEVECGNCRAIIFKKPSELRNLNFCSVKCMGDYYHKSGMFSGENSGTWAGGDINYYGPNWRIQRQKARERDNYTCQDCGITEEPLGHELSVHHIKLFRDFNGDWKSANELSNLLSLCEHPCHRKRHSNHLVDDIV